MAEEFYLKANENAPETGPFSSKKMRQLAAIGQISPETLVRRGDSSWVHASSVRGLEFNSGASPLAPPPAADASIPLGIPVTPTVAVTIGKPAAGADHKEISLSSRVNDPTGATGEAQVQAPANEPRPFDEAAPTPPSIVAPPPPPPVPPAALAVETKSKEKPASSEISEMISVSPSEKAEGKGKKKKAKQQSVRASSGETKSGGGFGALFSFDTMIAPTVAKVVYYVWLLLILFSWLGGTLALLVMGLMTAEGTPAIVGVLISTAGMLIGGGVIAMLYILGLRIVIEVVIAFFRAADDLAAIRAHYEEKS